MKNKLKIQEFENYVKDFINKCKNCLNNDFQLSWEAWCVTMQSSILEDNPIMEKMNEYR